MKAPLPYYQLGFLNEFEEEIYAGIVVFEKYISENERIICNVDMDLKGIPRGDNLKTMHFKHHHLIEEQLLQEFKKTQRFPILTFMYSFFEGKFKSLCETLMVELKYKTINADVDKNNIENYFSFLKQSLSIERPNLEKYFNEINRICRLRNKLLSGSVLSNDEMTTISKADNTIFLQEFLRNIEIFFSNLIVQIDKHYKTH